MYRFVSIFDTSVSSLNVGDSIIMDAVRSELGSIFPQAQLVCIPSHEKIGVTSLSIIRRSDASIVGGSNILSSYMNRYPQWRISFLDAFFIKQRISLLGVGWRDYQNETNLYSRSLLKRILRKEGFHSVRDSYSENKLREIGIDNVLNTGCPTMWGLTPAHCVKIPRLKSERVIFTLTDYNKDVERDTHLIKTLRLNYRGVAFWVQGGKDLNYFRSFGDLTKDIQVLPPNLKSYNSALDDGNVDYIGTRLHAGIRALQFGKRTIIIGIDNRAEEKRKDFALPVLGRDKIESLDKLINAELITEIRMPMENIDKWKGQFRNEGDKNY